MAHGIVRTDNLSGTTLGKDLVSILYKESDTNTDIDNGNVCTVGGFVSGHLDVRVGGKPAANSALTDICLIATPEVVKTQKYNTLAEFYNKAGTYARGYRLRTGDQFSVTADALDGTGALNKVVELQAGTKLKVVDELTSGSTKVGTIIAVDGPYFVIEVA